LFDELQEMEAAARWLGGGHGGSVEAMMRVIHKEPPSEHWDNSMTTRTLLFLVSALIEKTLAVVSKLNPLRRPLDA